MTQAVLLTSSTVISDPGTLNRFSLNLDQSVILREWRTMCSSPLIILRCAIVHDASNSLKPRQFSGFLSRIFVIRGGDSLGFYLREWRSSNHGWDRLEEQVSRHPRL
ncbi:hypothetical protein CC2G_005466 [Coprinopsis cinerea AmutBmut pab1-1]|nr:hypothetical protein CC2G_005466 [Coprinopsis cinerea AmutBmut pab1-1]